ncbi:MAG: Molybdopterin molybdenumtransferase, partial [Alphaproteobacteria bacterium MarineAlpha3_Bin4]
MISVAEALVKVKAGFSVVSSEQIGLADGLGRVLSEDVAARVSHPPMAVSAMDGYAVRALDVAGAPVDLKQIGESQAGAGFGGTVKTGETVRIFTGALLPEGADTIVMQENTKADGAQIQINESVEPGKFVRPAGMDFSEGELLLKAGTILSARDLGLVAAMNVPSLKVRRRPRVAFTATGEELSMPGGNLSQDQIVSSNSFAVAAYIETLGGVPLNLG